MNTSSRADAGPTAWGGANSALEATPAVPSTGDEGIDDGTARRTDALARVLLYCYHYPPSSEVAARRSGAIADFVARGGVQMTVVSAFDGRVPARDTRDGLIREYPVAQPRRRLLGYLVKFKRMVDRSSGPGSVLVTSAKVRETAASDAASVAPRGRGPLARLRDQLFILIHAIDEHKHWSWRSIRVLHAAIRTERPQLLLASGPPHSSLLAAAWTARRHGIPLVLDLRDPWSYDQRKYGADRSLLGWINRTAEHYVMRRVAAVISTTNGFARTLRDCYPELQGRIHVVRNGFDGSPAAQKESTGGRLSILFAGELYENRDPFPLLIALDRLLQRNSVKTERITLSLVGNCRTFRDVDLAQWLAGRRVEQVVRIVGPVPASEVARMTVDATVLLNLAQSQPIQVPAKTFEQLASGCEVLTICESNSDTSAIVDSIPGIIRVTPGDQESLDGAIADLYHRHVELGILQAPNLPAAMTYSRDSQNRKLMQLLEKIVANTGPARA